VKQPYNFDLLENNL